MVKEAVEGEEGSVIESAATDINTGGSADTISTTVEKAIEQGEREPVRKTGQELPPVRKTGVEVGNTPDSTYGETMPDRSWEPYNEKTNPNGWGAPTKAGEHTKPKGTTELPPDKEFDENMPDLETKVSKTSPLYTKPRGTTNIPEGVGKYPKTIGTPKDSPMFKERPEESIFTKIVEAPRRLKEKGEEVGYSAQQAYHKSREVPLEKAAKERYESRMSENDIKFEKGEISATIHKRRQMEYASTYESEKKPVEQRLVNTSVEVGNAFVAGLKHTQQKVAKEYRSSPAPRIKPSQGINTSRINNIGVRPAQTTSRKGKRSERAEPTPRYQINFGSSGKGTSTIDFSGGYGLFGRAEPKKKKR
jgi:hypothetical protein